MKIMTTAYVMGSVLLWLPTWIVNVAKRDGAYVKYVLTMVLSVVGVFAGQLICFLFNIFPDKNFTTTHKLIVYGIIPRAMILIVIAVSGKLESMSDEEYAGLVLETAE